MFNFNDLLFLRLNDKFKIHIINYLYVWVVISYICNLFNML